MSSTHNNKIQFLMTNLTTFSQLFHVKMENDFLSKYLSENEMKSILSSGPENDSHTKELLLLLNSHEQRNNIYLHLINRLFEIQQVHNDFIDDLVKQCNEDVEKQITVNEAPIQSSNSSTPPVMANPNPVGRKIIKSAARDSFEKTVQPVFSKSDAAQA